MHSVPFPVSPNNLHTTKSLLGDLGNRLQLLLNSLVALLFITIYPNNLFHGDTLAPNNNKLCTTLKEIYFRYCIAWSVLFNFGGWVKFEFFFNSSFSHFARLWDFYFSVWDDFCFCWEGVWVTVMPSIFSPPSPSPNQQSGPLLIRSTGLRVLRARLDMNSICFQLQKLGDKHVISLLFTVLFNGNIIWLIWIFHYFSLKIIIKILM